MMAELRVRRKLERDIRSYKQDRVHGRADGRQEHDDGGLQERGGNHGTERQIRVRQQEMSGARCAATGAGRNTGGTAGRQRE